MHRIALVFVGEDVYAYEDESKAWAYVTKIRSKGGVAKVRVSVPFFKGGR